MNDWSDIAARITEATGEHFVPHDARALHGGCINRALLLSDGTRRYFLKLNSPQRLDMFEAEAAGLEALAAPGVLRIPRVICHGLADEQSVLVLEYLALDGRLDGARAGEALAALHAVTAKHFGWHRDNTIGATPQDNTPSSDWAAFWRERRLAPQLALAAAQGHGGRLQRDGERLLDVLDALLDHAPAASLLHGDLWGGNIGATTSGEPVIFDPAVYYGDREADLAMTELFGGFDDRFYHSYRHCWAIDPGYTTRKVLYNLYHVLNHYNLFGGAYARQARGMIDQLIAEVS